MEKQNRFCVEETRNWTLVAQVIWSHATELFLHESVTWSFDASALQFLADSKLPHPRCKLKHLGQIRSMKYVVKYV